MSTLSVLAPLSRLLLSTGVWADKRSEPKRSITILGSSGDRKQNIMKCYSAVLVVCFSAVVVNFIPCHSLPTEAPFILSGQKSNFTYNERLAALTHCLEEKSFPEKTITQLRDLFIEVKGRTDGYYLARVAGYISDVEYLHAKGCFCRGVYFGIRQKKAKYCFSEEDEDFIIGGVCFVRRSARRLASVDAFPEICRVPTMKDLRNCCRSSVAPPS